MRIDGRMEVMLNVQCGSNHLARDGILRGRLEDSRETVESYVVCTG